MLLLLAATAAVAAGVVAGREPRARAAERPGGSLEDPAGDHQRPADALAAVALGIGAKAPGGHGALILPLVIGAAGTTFRPGEILGPH